MDRAQRTTGGRRYHGQYKIEYSNSSAATPADNTWRVLVANLDRRLLMRNDGTEGTQIIYTDDGSVVMLQEGATAALPGVGDQHPPAVGMPV